MECETRCICEQATGKISVIWLSLVTQFTLVLHDRKKKEEKGKKKKPLAGNLAAANREE